VTFAYQKSFILRGYPFCNDGFVFGGGMGISAAAQAGRSWIFLAVRLEGGASFGQLELQSFDD
jgi:hypothetical protein